MMPGIKGILYQKTFIPGIMSLYIYMPSLFCAWKKYLVVKHAIIHIIYLYYKITSDLNYKIKL